MFCSTYLNASISQTKLKQLRPTSPPHPADSARKEIICGRRVRKVEVFYITEVRVRASLLGVQLVQH